MGFTKEEKKVTEAVLKILKLSMGSTDMQFRERYYNYGVKTDTKERPVTIGGLDIEWMVDAVTAYLLEIPEAPELNLFDLAKLFGMYHNNVQIL